jgi:hypothetical protein
MNSSESSITKQIAIPRWLLLTVYLIVPVLLLVTLADMFYFDSILLPYMGIEAILIPIFIFIFNLPHIIASFFSFFDKEYVQYYQRQLSFHLPALLIATALLLYIDWRLGIVFFLINDVWHGIKQKVGIALILGAKPDWVHKAWTISPFVVFAVAYIYFIIPDAYPEQLIPIISPTLLIGNVAILLLMIVMMMRAVPAVRWYIFNVSMLFLVSYFFVLAGYIFFAVLAFRFVHDVSAFAFYVSHDYNRNLNEQKNWLYRVLTSVPLPVIVLTPLLGFLFAYVVRTATEGIVIGYSIVVLICMAHYYLESVMWKRGAPHRQYVRVV